MMSSRASLQEQEAEFIQYANSSLVERVPAPHADTYVRLSLFYRDRQDDWFSQKKASLRGSKLNRSGMPDRKR